jgi:DNA-binding MarR family transcriptional regulator
MTNVYISASEQMDVYNNLTVTEGKLYTLLKSSPMLNPDTEYFTSKNLAKVLEISISTLDNAKSALKKKGYALVIRFKDENQKNIVRVVVGKDQVELYNLGILCEITSARAYNKLLKKFPVTNPTLTEDQRNQLVNDLNEYYAEHAQEFK